MKEFTNNRCLSEQSTKRRLDDYGKEAAIPDFGILAPSTLIAFLFGNAYFFLRFAFRPH